MIRLAPVVLIVVATLRAPSSPRWSATESARSDGSRAFQPCWSPPGRFLMGSPQSEPERRLGEDQVQDRLTQGFWIGKYEVTLGDWKRIVGDLPGPLTLELPADDDLPVGNVNFAEAESFCGKLTKLAIASRQMAPEWESRVPTEAQWKYACRAGTATPVSFGDSLDRKKANFQGKPYNGGPGDGPSLGKASKVGRYPANAWGIHDMHGNASEWCREMYHPNLPGGDDPDLYDGEWTAARNRDGTRSRVRRGGAWTDDGWTRRTAFCSKFEPDRRYDHIGFRVVAVKLPRG